MGMRIISGEWRGRPLVAPAGATTRPTADRARETLFSMLASRLGGFTDLIVADLFAGSGALGLEALSRGAARCRFVERDRDALTALRRNIATLKAEDRAIVVPGAVEGSRSPEAASLIFMDPPYATLDAPALIARLGTAGWLAPDCWLAIETARDEAPTAEGFAVAATRDVGKARLTLLRR